MTSRSIPFSTQRRNVEAEPAARPAAVAGYRGRCVRRGVRVIQPRSASLRRLPRTGSNIIGTV
ncbi:hypothetical protein ACWGBO_14925 [[Kitasatospora] papulosa]